MWPVSLFVDNIYEHKKSFDDGLALAQRLGLGYIDLRSVDGVQFVTLSDDDLDEVRRRVAKHGLKVAALASPLFKCPLRGTEGLLWGAGHNFDRHLSYEDHLEMLPRVFQIAERFGVGNIRCFAFWRQQKPAEVLDEVVEKLGRAVRIAERAGHTLYLENEMNTCAGTGIEMARIIRAIGSPHLTGILDIGNTGRLGGVAYPDDYEALRGLISHVHVKFEVVDVLCGWGSPGRSWYSLDTPLKDSIIKWHQPDLPISGQLRFGDKTIQIEGRRTVLTVSESVQVDYRGLFTALKDDGYGGFLAIDSGSCGGPENTDAKVKKCVEGLRSMVAEVWAGQ